ncbi:hypothetical protein [Nocardia sp. NPDC058666]|uniref:hypothetical protein n=1 Tax=Nocardia sp. NPDC058666 TaxID=3346587 RepID=UPI00365A5558
MAIARIRLLAAEIGDQVRWGLGEGNARLISAAALVARLRCVAGATDNSITAALDAHARIVEDLRLALLDVCDRMVIADRDWADRLHSVELIAGQSDPPVPESR